MVEVVERERVGDGELLSFAFELLGGVFKQELDSPCP